jgi:cytochrome subunit of sulfide dehydrogenase
MASGKNTLWQRCIGLNSAYNRRLYSSIQSDLALFRCATETARQNNVASSVPLEELYMTRTVAETIAIAAVAAGAALALPAWGQSTDPHLARNLAATCANCHGTTGQSVAPMPTLAGLSKDNIGRAMREFRDGKRPATVMHQLAKGYTDEQIDLIAGYFAAQKAR